MQRFSFRILAVMVITAAATSTATPQPAHTDCESFALPAEAVARVGSARLRPGGFVYGLLWTGDGKTLFSTAHGGPLHIWEAGTGKLRHTTAEQFGSRPHLALAKGGQAIHVVTRDHHRLLNAATGKELRRLKFAEADYYCVSPAGNVLATLQRDGSVRLVDLATGKDHLVRKFEGSTIRALALAPDGKRLAVGYEDGLVQVFDAATGNALLQIQRPAATVSHLAFAPDGTQLLTDGNARAPATLWSVPAGKEQARLAWPMDEMYLWCSAFSPDGKYVALGANRQYVPLYDTTTGKEVRRFATGAASLSLAFGPDGKTLAVGTNVGTISLWNVATAVRLPASADPSGSLQPRRFLPGNRLVALADTFRVYDWTTGRLLQQSAKVPTFGTIYTAWADLSPDRTLMVSGTADRKSCVIMDAVSGKPLRTIAVSDLGVWQTRFSTDGSKLFTSSRDRVVRVWESATGKCLHELTGHGGTLTNLTLSPDGRSLAAYSIDGSAGPNSDVRLWDLATGKLRRRLPARHGVTSAVAFSPTGTELAVAGGLVRQASGRGDVSVFDVRNGTEVKPFLAHPQWVTGIAYSPDGRALATGSTDGYLRLWELASGKERHRFEGHRAERITDLLFSPDGSLLAAASDDAPVYLWSVYGRPSLVAPLPDAAEARARLWRDLAGDDACVAFDAIRCLVHSPASAVALVRDHIKPAAPIDEKRVGQLIATLDSDDFDMRQNAHAELTKLGDRIEAPLRQALAGAPTVEAKRRIGELLTRLDAPTPELLARSRALEALEHIRTPETLQLLATLAAGARGARLTREAAAVLQRVRGR